MELPPIHPAIVHFPIALIIVAFFADLVARLTKRESIRNLGFWCLLVALATGVLTVLAGLLDRARVPLDGPSRDYVNLHMYTGLTLALVLVVLTVWRWRIWHARQLVVSRSFLGLGVLLLALTVFQGWYGGEIVYSQGVGVAAADRGTEPAFKAQHRLATVSRILTGKDFSETAIGSPPGSEQGKSSKTNRSGLDNR